MALKNFRWEPVYHPAVIKDDIPRLGSVERDRIKKAIENKLTADPTLYGQPLRGTLKPYWKIRVGEYRIVYATAGNEVRILAIAHRKEIYQMADRRD